MENQKQISYEELYEGLFDKILAIEGFKNIQKQEFDERNGWKDNPEVIVYDMDETSQDDFSEEE